MLKDVKRLYKVKRGREEEGMEEERQRDTLQNRGSEREGLGLAGMETDRAM